jgi:hypothetical protein
MINNFKKIFSYLKFLSPILISKHYYNCDEKDLLKELRLNTQSAFGDEKQLLRDKKLGRTKKDEAFQIIEYPKTILLRNGLIWETNLRLYTYPTSIIFLNKKSSILVLNYPGIWGSIYLILIFFCLVMTIFNDLLLFNLLTFTYFSYENYNNHISYKKQNEFILGILKKCTSS